MPQLKRIPVKYIRDRAKSAYQKDDCCYICGVESPLDLHHYASVDQLFTKWSRKNKIVIKEVDDILACRDDFIEEHHDELYVGVVTLCKKHHQMLHKVYGPKPLLPTAEKQARWVEKQRNKFLGEE